MPGEEERSELPISPPVPSRPESMGKRKKKTVVEKKSDGSKTKRKRKHSFTKTKDAESNELGNTTRTDFTVDGSSPHVEANSAISRALEVQSNLEAAFPSFVKTLLRSHCQDRYRMGLPGYFSRHYLPQEDVSLILEDEDGKCFETKYFTRDAMLGAGWRQFCHTHQLDEGDVLVFQLVEPTRFKVYIVKIDNLNEVDGALGLLGLDSSSRRLSPEDDQEDEEARRSADREYLVSPPTSYVRRRKKKKVHEKTSEQSHDQSEKLLSKVLEGSKPAVPAVQFEDIGSLEDFKILANGKVLNSEFPEDVLKKYYELCLNQGGSLHVRIIEGINDQLITSSISEIVSVADAVRGCRDRSARVMSWDRTLKALEMLGMNVGFLRERVKRLMSLNFDWEDAEQRYREAEEDRSRTDEEIKRMEQRLEEMKEGNKKLRAEVESLKHKAEFLLLEFQEVATAPW